MPKCACSAVKRALWTAEAEVQGLPAPPSRGKIHDIASSPFTLEPIHVKSSTFVFTIVRNPVTRLISAYADKVVYVRNHAPELLLPQLRGTKALFSAFHFIDFLYFIRDLPDAARDTHWRSLTRLTNEQALPSNFIGRYESLDSDMRTIFSQIYPQQSPTLERVNSRRGDVAYHTPTKTELALISEIYRQDFANFGYDPDDA